MFIYHERLEEVAYLRNEEGKIGHSWDGNLGAAGRASLSVEVL